jgi:hypothetical protein
LGWKDARGTKNVSAAIAGVHAWNERKKKMMHPDHIRMAWQRLHEQEWI